MSMGRRKGNEGDAVSLFPFMSILVCLIGSLTLMITIQMSGQANSEQSQEEIERYRKYTELKAVMEQDQAELESLKRLLAQAEKAHEEILEAIRAHDPDATRKLVLAHLQDFEKRIRRYLQSREGGDGRPASRASRGTAPVERVERLRRTS